MLCPKEQVQCGGLVKSQKRQVTRAEINQQDYISVIPKLAPIGYETVSTSEKAFGIFFQKEKGELVAKVLKQSSTGSVSGSCPAAS